MGKRVTLTQQVANMQVQLNNLNRAFMVSKAPTMPPIAPMTATGAAILNENKASVQDQVDAFRYAVKTAHLPSIMWDFPDKAPAQAPLTANAYKKDSLAKVRNLKAYEAVKYALRKMHAITIILGETAFTIQLRRYGDTVIITLNSFDQTDYFSEVNYTDKGDVRRTAGYATLATAVADVTALAMFYATR